MTTPLGPLDDHQEPWKHSSACCTDFGFSAQLPHQLIAGQSQDSIVWREPTNEARERGVRRCLLLVLARAWLSQMVQHRPARQTASALSTKQKGGMSP